MCLRFSHPLGIDNKQTSSSSQRPSSQLGPPAKARTQKDIRAQAAVGALKTTKQRVVLSGRGMEWQLFTQRVQGKNSSGERVSERDLCTWRRDPSAYLGAQSEGRRRAKAYVRQLKKFWNFTGTLAAAERAREKRVRRGRLERCGQHTVIEGIEARTWTCDAILGKAGC